MMLSRGVCRAANASRSFSAATRVVLVDGCRTPFQMSGTGYNDLMAQDLGRIALRGLLDRHPQLDPAKIDNVLMGTVIQDCKTSNIAREAALSAGIPDTVPAFTVTLACISSNVAMSNASNLIKAGQAEIVIASGTETMSDVPIRHSKNMRKMMLASQKVKSPAGWLKLLQKFKMKDLTPELPAIAEFSTNETMGHSADRLASKFGVTRGEQDQFALRSHQLGAKALKNELKSELLEVGVPPKFAAIDTDNGCRPEFLEAKMDKLKPAFIKPHGTVTAANASYLTDGASALLLMSESKAKELGYAADVELKDYIYTAQDPKEQLLLGPAYATAKLLAKNKLTLNDIDVIEFHEAFAAQVLANLRALESEKFCTQSIGVGSAVGSMPMERFNTLGGSLSLGHPFGATGCRIATTAANRLRREDKKLALIAACAAGGQAVAMLLERQ